MTREINLQQENEFLLIFKADLNRQQKLPSRRFFKQFLVYGYKMLES